MPLTLDNLMASKPDRELWVQWNPSFEQCEVYKIRFLTIFYGQYFYSSFATTAYWFSWYGSKYVVWDHEPTKAEQENVEWEDSSNN